LSKFNCNQKGRCPKYNTNPIEGHCFNGYIYYEDKDKNEVVKKCDRLKKYIESQQLNIRLKKASIPRSDFVLNYDIDKSYFGEESIGSVSVIKSYILNFKELGFEKHMYFHGVPSTQKTTLAFYIGRELTKKGFKVKYILMDFLIKILMSEKFEDGQAEIIKQVIDADCLIIDESFDKQKINWYKSDYQLSFIDSFLRTRLDQFNRSTIFISNKMVENVKEFSNNLFNFIERNTLDHQLEFKDILNNNFNAVKDM